MARYTIKIVKFGCVDEPGCDFVGSDEIFWVFTANAGGQVRTTTSRVFGNVDTGDCYDFPTDRDRNIVWPHKGAAQGADGPIGLSIQLWESDQGKPESIGHDTAAVLSLLQAARGVGNWVTAVGPVVRSTLVDLTSDDLMGSTTLLYTASRLQKQLPAVGGSMLEKHRIGRAGGDLQYEVAGGPNYDLHLKITRVV